MKLRNIKIIYRHKGVAFGHFIVLTALVSGILFSCGNNNPPEGILSKNEMAKALTEFYLKESKINSLHIPPDSALILFQYYKQKYAEEINIPDSALETSYQYYLGRPTELSAIYDQIIDSLALKEQKGGSAPH